MLRKFVLYCAPIIVVLAVLGLPAYAGVTVSYPVIAHSWPDISGRQPMYTNYTDPNSPTGGSGSGDNERVGENFNNRAMMQTFRVPPADSTHYGFTLTNIVITGYGSGNTALPPCTLHLYDLNQAPEQPVGDDDTIYNLAYWDSIPNKYDFFAASNQVVFTSSFTYPRDETVNPPDKFVQFDFSELHKVDLEPNHLYAFEIWPQSGTDPGWYWIRDVVNHTGGRSYKVDPPLDFTNLTTDRSQTTASSRDQVLGLYGLPYDGNAFHPMPQNYAMDVPVNTSLTWTPGKDANTTQGHQLWFGTGIMNVRRRLAIANMGRIDPCSWTPPAVLVPETMYYWRVDEYGPGAPLHADGNYYWGVGSQGSTATNQDAYIWRFTTTGPKARIPVPADGTQSVELSLTNLQLSWTAGAFAADTNGHHVYFGTDYNSVNSDDANTPSDPINRGYRNPTNYSLLDLVDDYTLESGKTYYWRVDEVNIVTSPYVWKGSTWSFRMPSPAFINIESFPYTTQTALDAVWQSGYGTVPNVNGGTISVNAGNLVFAYRNNYNDGEHGRWSEAKLDYNGVGADWTVNGLLDTVSIAVSYDGNVMNRIKTEDPNYDAMYMAIEDTAGRFDLVINPELDTQIKSNLGDKPSGQDYSWRTWRVDLAEFASPNSVDLTDVNRFYLGFGVRGSSNSGSNLSRGTVRFDNIRLYVPMCVPEKTPIEGDLAGPAVNASQAWNPNTKRDCQVNLWDFFYMIADDLNGVSIPATNGIRYEEHRWLKRNDTLNYPSATPPPDANMTLRYKFDQTSIEQYDGTTVIDSSGNGRNGTVWQGHPAIAEPFLWAEDHDDANTTGHSLNLQPGYKTWVEVPPSAYDNNHGGVTFSFWINGEINWPPDSGPSIFTMHREEPNVNNTNPPVSGMQFEVQLPYLGWPAQGGHGYGPQDRWNLQKFANSSSTKAMGTGTRTGNPWRALSDFGGKWNHWALVFNADTNTIAMYVNGRDEGHLSVPNSVDLNNDIVPENLWDDVNSFRIGTISNRGLNTGRGPGDIPTSYPNTGFWYGKLDEFRIYNKALSAEEIQWLATNGTGTRTQPFVETYNLQPGDSPEINNFRDFAILAQKWLDPIVLWP